MTFLKRINSSKNIVIKGIGACILITANLAAAGASVPSHTYFQATKLINAEYPNAIGIKITPYITESISGVVGKVLNASTVIEFQTEGKSHRVIMLPDGQHLLIGNIVKPQTTAKRQQIKTEISSVTANKRQLDRIEKDHKLALPPQRPPVDLSKISMAKARMKAEDLKTNSFDHAPEDVKVQIDMIGYKPLETPEQFMTALENHDSIKTGTGPLDLYILMDPNCPNCRKEYLSSVSQHEQFTFHWIPVFTLKPAPDIKHAALSQVSNDRNRANLDSIMRSPSSTHQLEVAKDQAVAQKVLKNQTFAFNLQDRSTPITIYRSKDGSPTKHHGYMPKIYEMIRSDME